jgi:hypothetical protein
MLTRLTMIVFILGLGGCVTYQQPFPLPQHITFTIDTGLTPEKNREKILNFITKEYREANKQNEIITLKGLNIYCKREYENRIVYDVRILTKVDFEMEINTQKNPVAFDLTVDHISLLHRLSSGDIIVHPFTLTLPELQSCIDVSVKQVYEKGFANPPQNSPARN